LDNDRDRLRRENILFTSDELFGLQPRPGPPAGGLGGSGHAPPSFPHARGFTFLAALFDLLFLICPMHDTLGDDGSGVRYPLPLPLPPLLLLPAPRASGGTMDTIGPENALRWLNDDAAVLPLPLPPPCDANVVVEDEKDAAVDLRNDARTPPAPPPVKLLDLACLCFLSITTRAASLGNLLA
jgi:hypothetical protein